MLYNFDVRLCIVLGQWRSINLYIVKKNYKTKENLIFNPLLISSPNIWEVHPCAYAGYATQKQGGRRAAQNPPPRALRFHRLPAPAPLAGGNPVGPPLPPRTSSSSLPACVKWPASFHCVVAGMKTPVRAQRTPGRPGGGPGSGSPGNAGFLVALCGDRRRAEGFSLANFGFDRFVRGLEISWGFDWVARRVGSGPVRQKFYIPKHACAA